MSWFVLNYIPVSLSASRRKAGHWVQHFNDQNSLDLELFAPTFFVYDDNKEKKGLQEKPLTYHYVFVKGEFEDVKKLCLSGYGFYFILTDTGDEVKKYAKVSDKNMESFRLIARRYSNSLPFYPLDNVNLEDGDFVRIVEGDFSGLEGYFFPKAKSAKGRVVLQIAKNSGTAVFDVPTRYIQILQFSPKSNIKYHLVDRFLPKYLDIMSRFAQNPHLSEEDITELTIFVRRMGIVTMDKPITEAKLAALLLGSARMLGDEDEETKAVERLQKSLRKLESPSVRALIHIIEGITGKGGVSSIEEGLAILHSDDASSDTLSHLLLAMFSRKQPETVTLP